MRLLRQLIRPNAVSRRLMSAIGGAFLLVALLFFSLFVIVESDHDCSGLDCPVCIQLQACVAGERLSGPLPISGVSLTSVERICPDKFNAPDFRAPVLTLHAIDVRFNE